MPNLWFVKVGGTGTSANATNPSTPFSTLNAAVNAAAANDTIFVASGVYNESGSQIWVNKSLTIIGGWDASGSEWSTGMSATAQPSSPNKSISGTTSQFMTGTSPNFSPVNNTSCLRVNTATSFSVYISASNVIMKYFHIFGLTATSGSAALIKVGPKGTVIAPSGLTLDYITFEDKATTSGAYTNKCLDINVGGGTAAAPIVVSNCYIPAGSTYGMAASSCHYLTISGCTFATPNPTVAVTPLAIQATKETTFTNPDSSTYNINSQNILLTGNTWPAYVQIQFDPAGRLTTTPAYTMPRISTTGTLGTDVDVKLDSALQYLFLSNNPASYNPYATNNLELLCSFFKAGITSILTKSPYNLTGTALTTSSNSALSSLMDSYNVQDITVSGTWWVHATQNYSATYVETNSSRLVSGGTYASHANTVNTDTGVAAATLALFKPSAPTVAALDVASQQLTVSWADNAGWSATTSFDVDLSGSNGITSTSTNVTSPRTFTGLTNGVTYTVIVTAKNASGSSSASRSALVGRISDAPAEGSTTVGNGTLSINWSAPADNGGSAITAYNVYWTNRASVSGSTLGLSASATSYQITGLSDEQYDWSVGAVNAFGEARSATVAWFTPAIPPDAPGTPSAVAGNESVDLTWSMSGVSNGGATITHYNVYNGSTDVLDVSSTTNSVTVTGLTNGSSYSFYVKAVNAIGEGAASASSSSVTPAQPVTLDLSGLSVVYNGSAQSPVVTGIDAQYVDLTSDGSAFSGATAAGTYSVTATLNNAAYSSSPVTRTFTITQAPLTITAANQSRAYYSPLTFDVSTCSYTDASTVGSAIVSPVSYSAATFECSALYGSDSVTGVTITLDSSYNQLITSVGSYAGVLQPSAATGTGVSNYSITYVPGDLTVNATAPPCPVPQIASHFEDVIVFSWLPMANNGGVDITSYTVYYWPGSLNVDNFNFLTDASQAVFNASDIEGANACAIDGVTSELYIFMLNATNSVGASVFYGLYNETAANYAEGIIKAASQLSFITTYNATTAELIKKIVQSSGVSTYAGIETLREGASDVDTSIYASAEAEAIALAGGANLGVQQGATGAEAQAIYDHMYQASQDYPGTVEQSLLDQLFSDLTNNIPFPITYSQFYIGLDGQQATPYPVIQATGDKASIVPVPHDISINFYLNVVSNVNPDLSGQVLITRSPDNLISNVQAANGVTSISDFTSPAAAGSIFYVHLTTGPIVPVMIPALADTVVMVGPEAPTGLSAYHQASTIYVKWDQVSTSLGLTSYNVTTPGHSWTVTPPSPGAAIPNSLAITTLDIGQNWTFTVTAVKGANSSAAATVQYLFANLPCFTVGTRILTPTGYRKVETLCDGDLVVTAAGLTVPVKVYSNTFKAIAKGNAPYIISAHAFGRNAPPAELRLSPLHAFQIRKGVWQSGRTANNPKVKQYDIGKDVTYYHLECPNYFRDNLVVDGCVVESFAGKQVAEHAIVYTPCPRLGGFTRASGSGSSSSKISHC